MQDVLDERQVRPARLPPLRHRVGHAGPPRRSTASSSPVQAGGAPVDPTQRSELACPATTLSITNQRRSPGRAIFAQILTNARNALPLQYFDALLSTGTTTVVIRDGGQAKEHDDSRLMVLHSTSTQKQALLSQTRASHYRRAASCRIGAHLHVFYRYLRPRPELATKHS